MINCDECQILCSIHSTLKVTSMQEGLNPSCLLEGMPGFYLSPSRKELPFQWDKCKCQGNDIPCPVANFRMNATLVTIYAGLEGRIPVDQGQNGCCSMSRTASGEILREIMDIHRRGPRQILRSEPKSVSGAPARPKCTLPSPTF